MQKTRGSPSEVVGVNENSKELENAGTDSTLLLTVGSATPVHDTNLPVSKGDQMAGTETVETADDVPAAKARAAAVETVEIGASEEECTAPAPAAEGEGKKGGEGEEGRQAPPATTAPVAEPQSGESGSEIDAAISVSAAGAAGVEMVLPSSKFNLPAIACQREEIGGVGVGAEPSGSGGAGDQRKRKASTTSTQGQQEQRACAGGRNKRCRSGGAEGNVTKASKTPWWEAREKGFITEEQVCI